MTVSTRAGLALATASVLAIAGFSALGSVFDYPHILKRPTDQILTSYRDHQTAVMAWFAILAVSAALIGPAGVWLGRLTGGRLGRWVAVTGVAAAVVQVAGLQRWVTIVPGISDDALDPAQRGDAEDRFDFWHTLLGRLIGETLGYALTAAFTVLVAVALGRALLPNWLATAGVVSAAFIGTGVLIPVVDVARLTNFVGYVVWCAWLFALAALLIRTDRPGAQTSADHAASQT